MVDVSVVILTYKAKEWVRKNLDSLRKSYPILKTYGYTWEIFVIDNTEGGDGTCEMIEEDYKEVVPIPVKQNIGFPKGNNLGIRKSSGRYVLLLNPDSIVEENTIPEMIKYMDENKNVGISTCKVELVTNKKIDPASHRGFPTPWASLTYYLGLEKTFPKSKIFGQYHQTWKDLSKEHEIDSCVGSFLLIRREALNDIGGVICEDYFMYAEDIDTCYRVKSYGWKIVYYPKVKVFHYKGFASGIRKETQAGSTATKEHKIKMINAFWDANLLFFNKHLKAKYPFFVAWAVYIAVWLKKQIAFRQMHI